jgi:hypothetical protein
MSQKQLDSWAVTGMAEITPSLADSPIIRTYPTNYAQLDTESEGEAQFEVDTEDEEQHSISTRLNQNQQYMDQQITPSGRSAAWMLEPQTWKATEDTGVVLIKNQQHQICHTDFSIHLFTEIFKLLVL